MVHPWKRITPLLPEIDSCLLFFLYMWDPEKNSFFHISMYFYSLIHTAISGKDCFPEDFLVLQLSQCFCFPLFRCSLGHRCKNCNLDVSPGQGSPQSVYEGWYYLCVKLFLKDFSVFWFQEDKIKNLVRNYAALAKW